jgi:hypothetical protein
MTQRPHRDTSQGIDPLVPMLEYHELYCPHSVMLDRHCSECFNDEARDDGARLVEDDP